MVAVFILSGLFAQIDRELVLVEVSTAVWGQFCPGAQMGTDDLLANGDPVAVIANHHNDGFSNQYSEARNSYYNNDAYPYAYFDGKYDEVFGGWTDSSMYYAYLPVVNARMAIQTAFDISISGTHIGDDYDITITVTKVGTFNENSLQVRLALTESHIPFNWWGMTELNNVNRLMVPTAAGTTVDFSDGDTQTVELSFTFNNTWDINECELIAFVQSDVSLVNQHVAKVMVTDIPEYEGFVADFYADDTLFCSTPAVVHFFDSSFNGDPVSWNWYFEGGIPETSLDENPVVTYLDEGDFDVQLIASDGTETDTLLMENYIHVHNGPDVYWENVPGLCNQGDDPYLLTEGRPEGGVYSGEFVTEGKYFHPTQAGVGQHVVTYFYTNEYGCTDSADYTITVDECVGIGEEETFGLELYPNPTKGILNVSISATEFSRTDLKVLNVLGKEIYTQKGLNINGNYSTRIDLSAQPGGVYFVVISGDDQKIIRKILLNR